MSQTLEARYNELPPDQQAAVQATLVVEVKIRNLRTTAQSMPEHAIERALADHRKKAHEMMSPAAHAVVEGTLRERGILKLGHIPAPRTEAGFPKLEGGATA